MCANERCDDYVCYTGYEKTDDICKDIDECDEDKCPENANCLNTDVRIFNSCYIDVGDSVVSDQRFRVVTNINCLQHLSPKSTTLMKPNL